MAPFVFTPPQDSTIITRDEGKHIDDRAFYVVAALISVSVLLYFICCLGSLHRKERSTRPVDIELATIGFSSPETPRFVPPQGRLSRGAVQPQTRTESAPHPASQNSVDTMVEPPPAYSASHSNKAETGTSS